MALDPKKVKNFVKQRKGSPVKTHGDDDEEDGKKKHGAPFGGGDDEKDDDEKSDPGTDMSGHGGGGDEHESTPGEDSKAGDDDEHDKGGDDDADHGGDDDDDDPNDPNAAGGHGEGSGKLGEFGDELREQADMLSDIASEADGLPMTEDAELSPDVKSKIAAEIGAMPPDFQKGFRKHVKNLSWADAHELASELEDDGTIDDAETFGAWLYFAGQAA